MGRGLVPPEGGASRNVRGFSVAVLDALRRKVNFTDMEADIADYILQYADDVAEMNIGELSAATFTSNATIVRFCRKLGVDGYRSFRIALAREVEASHARARAINPDLPFIEGSNTQQIIRSVATLTKQAIDACAQTVTAHDIRKAARLIRNARHIAYYALGDSFVSLEGFANLLLKIGIVTYSGNANGDSLVVSHTLGLHDLAIVVSYSGNLVEYGDLAENLQFIRSRGCKMVLVTANAQSAERIAGLECLVLLPGDETDRGSVATYYSQSCIRYALNCIYGECFAQDWKGSMALRESFANSGRQERLESAGS